MAPRLPTSKLHLIRDMIESQSFTTSQMAEEAECTKLTIINIRRNLRQFGAIHAPQTRIGRKRTVTPLMIKALVTAFLRSLASISMRWLSSCGMSFKP